MTTQKPFFLDQNRSLGEIDASADLLHTEVTKQVRDDSATETQYFGFSVPEAGIHALCYLWHRPNLRIVTGGAWAWQGIKRTAVHSELFDMRTFMNDSFLENDLHDFRMVNGYGVKIIEPLQKFHMTYADEARGNSIDLMHEAVAPAVMFGDGNHFEQAMKVTGELVLRGKRYEVNCYNIRDRSWGKPRQEDHTSLPPTSWMTAVFNDDFALNCNVLDQASRDPEVPAELAIPDERTLSGGWIYRNGQVGCIVEAKKRVARAPETHLPTAIDLEVTDELDRQVKMTGRLVASCPWEAWGNVMMHISLMRWESEGQVTYGDCQEAHWTDYLHLMQS